MRVVISLLLLVLATFLYGVVFPYRIEAKIGLTIPIIEAEDIRGNFQWKRLPLPAIDADTPKAYAHTAFKLFFEQGYFGVPENVKVLNATLENGLLTIDVSEDILLYDGSASERALVEQLVKIAAEIPGAEKFTLTIDGFLQPLVKGTEINAICLFPVSLSK